MVSTTLAAAVMLGAIGTGANPSPGWQTDYAQAMTLAASEHKPMAVFIGTGNGTAGRMLQNSAIPAEALQLLRNSYVCVYLDTATAAGKELATRFEMPEGLVISSPGGNVQALRHAGAVAGADLTRQLTQYASAGQPVTTITSGVAVVSASTPVYSAASATYSTPLNSSVVTAGYSPASSLASPVVFASSCPNGRCGTTAPTMNYASPAIRYAPMYPTANPFGSSCPNGRCPNQR